MNHLLAVLTYVFLGLITLPAEAQNYEVYSPDRQIKVNIEVGRTLSYAVKYNDRQLIYPSEISLAVSHDLIIGNQSIVADTSLRFVNNKIIPFVKEKRALIDDIYNEIIIRFTTLFELHFRVYDNGVAYRFASRLNGEIIIVDEEATFNFQPGTTIYYPEINKRGDADIFHTSFEEPYIRTTIDSLSEEIMAFSPLLLKHANLPNILITESDIDDYPGMFISKGPASGLKGIFAAYPVEETVSGNEFKQKLVTKRAPYISRTIGPRSFPWRVIAIAPTDGDLLLNDLVYCLAPDPDYHDFSWIIPGKSTEEWITGLNLYNVDFMAGLNTETYKYYIDFASTFGFEYVMLDAGWSDVNDLFDITPEMNMEEITGYAKQKNVGLILWTQALTIEKQMKQAFEQFRKWDIKIIMTDFIDRNDQLAMNFMHRFARECANNRFMCMIHGAPPPAGFTRTHPNMLTREGVLGSEYNIWSSKANPEHDLMLPFIRMVAGPMDYEPGILQHATREQTVKMGFEKVIAQGTRMHQIAMFVVYDSPLQLFSGNLSDAFREPDLMKFLGDIPTVWDETLVLKAEFGKHIVEARRNGDYWYLAAINDWTPVEFSIPLSFLKDGKFLVEIACDGLNASKNPQDYKLEKLEILAKDRLLINLAPGGGFVARISKIDF